MCGIIGYVGHRPAVPVVIEGLRALEYRGYDSAGVAFIQNHILNIIRAKGKLSALEEKLANASYTLATTAIGHTRWATHGVPAEHNAHPHASNDAHIALIHNGIIENYLELKQMLTEKGYTFTSETDTEVLVNLIAEGKKHTKNMYEAFIWAVKQAQGAYAIAMISQDDPKTIYAARFSAPLVIGLGVGENFVASDITAFLPYTREVIFLEDGEIVSLTNKECSIEEIETGKKVNRTPQRIEWDIQSAQKGGFKHFMLKEIFEQPRVITDCLTGRLNKQTVVLPELEALFIPKRLHIVACGTSWNSGLWAQSLLELWSKIPVSLEIASEFRYRAIPLDAENELVLVISQSGETADTLAALRHAKKMGVKTIGLCNVVGSSIAREADTVIYTQAGPEISVASTKAMCSQMLLLLLISLYWAQKKNSLSQEQHDEILTHVTNLAPTLETALATMRSKAQECVKKYSKAKSFFYLGRGQNFALALEGALKLKELSYIHAEGYAAGEMKHGPIALIDSEFPTFVIALNDTLLPKTLSNVQEVQARNGKIIALVNPQHPDFKADELWEVPAIHPCLNGFIALPALQLFSYEMADYLGKDVDQPRNLAKSVTVE